MFKRYSLIKTLTKNFNILSNADANADANANADADADAGVIAIALPVLSYRRAKKVKESVTQELLYLMKSELLIIMNCLFIFQMRAYLR